MELNSIIIIVACLITIVVVFLSNRKKNALPSSVNDEVVRLQALLESTIKNKEELKKHYEQMLVDERERAINDKESALREKEMLFEKIRKEDELRHKNEFDTFKENFDRTMAELHKNVKGATEDLLQERQKELSESNNKNLGDILNPLKESIEKMKSTMQENSEKQTSFSEIIKEQASLMIKKSEDAKRSAEKLTEAFMHKSKVQGDWGEKVLEDLLNNQKMIKGRDYDTQYTLRDSDNNVLKNKDNDVMRPDLVLHLDKDRDVIIDSKVSLTAYFEYVNADNDGDNDMKEIYMKKHIDSIQSHVDELAAKEYYKYHAQSMIDFVIMFVPHTESLRVVLDKDPLLWYKAMEKRVFIADGLTLYAALQIIKRTWSQIDQEKNFNKLIEYAEELRDRVGEFLTSYNDIGKALDQANKAYHTGKIKLDPSGKSISTTIGKIMNAFSLANMKGKKGKNTTKITPAIPNNYLPLDEDAKSLMQDNESINQDSQSNDTFLLGDL